MKPEDSKKYLKERFSLISAKTSEYIISEPLGFNKNKDIKEKEKNIYNFNPNYMGSCKSKSINMTEFCNDIENVKFDNISTYIHDETDNISNFNKKVSNNKCIDSNFNNYLKNLKMKSNNKDEEEFDLNCIEKGNIENCKFKDPNETKMNYNFQFNISSNINTNVKSEIINQNSTSNHNLFSVKKNENDKRNLLKVQLKTNNANNTNSNNNNKSEYSQIDSCKSSCDKIIRSKFCKLTGDMFNKFRNELKIFSKEKGDNKAMLILKLLKQCKITKETLYSKHNYTSIIFFLNNNFIEFLCNVIVNLILHKSDTINIDKHQEKNNRLNLLLRFIIEIMNRLDYNSYYLNNQVNQNPISDINIDEFRKEIENLMNFQSYHKKSSYLSEEGNHYLETIKEKYHMNCTDLKLIENKKIKSVSISTNIDSKSMGDLELNNCIDSKSTFEDFNKFDFKWDINYSENNFDLNSIYSQQTIQKFYSSNGCND